MSENIINYHPAFVWPRITEASLAQPTAPARKRTDLVEGLRIDPAAELPASSFRTAWLRAIRAEISDGTYETPERINGTVDRLLDVLA